MPGTGLDVPLWILGSSLYGAQLAAALGLPYAFASHFAPDELDAGARDCTARSFRPSAQLAAPYAMVGVNAVVAATDAEARRLFTSVQQGVHESVARRARPAAAADRRHRELLDAGREGAGRAHARVLVRRLAGDGARAAVDFVARTHADELIVAAAIFDQAARLRSYELLADARTGASKRSWTRCRFLV